MTEAHLFALGLALACLAGVRVYLTVFGLGLAAWLGWVDLPANLQVVSDPWVLWTAGALTVIEFAADKIPGIDSGWDLINTLARVPAGAFLANAAIAPTDEWNVGALALGGTAALAIHTLKSGARVLINHSPEPASNLAASVGEDILAISTLSLVYAHPWWALAIFLSAFVAFVLTVVLLFRGARGVLRTVFSPRVSEPKM